MLPASNRTRCAATRYRRCAPTACLRLSAVLERLTYRYNSRDYRLTDVYGEVVGEILA